MSTSRAVAFFAGLLMVLGLCVWLEHERNDVAFTTRSLIGQVRKGGKPVELALYEQKRFPEGDRVSQEQVFDALTGAMQRSPHKNVTYGQSGKMKLDNGGEVPWRDVLVECENGDRYAVKWVKWQANWYIYDFKPQP